MSPKIKSLKWGNENENLVVKLIIIWNIHIEIMNFELFLKKQGE